MSGMLYHIALKYLGQIWNLHESPFNLNAKEYTAFMSIYSHFSPSIMSSKPYACPICGKRAKSINKLTRYLNTCKSRFYLKLSHKPLQHKSHNKKDALGENWEDESDLLEKMITTTNTNSILETSTENILRKGLFASESLSALREEWFSSHEFFAGIFISDKKYKYLRFKYKNYFYPFNNQLDYGLAHYFTNSETTKGNMNKLLTDLLMAPITKKLPYKNADKWMEKLSEIPWGISNDK